MLGQRELVEPVWETIEGSASLGPSTETAALTTNWFSYHGWAGCGAVPYTPLHRKLQERSCGRDSARIRWRGVNIWFTLAFSINWMAHFTLFAADRSP